jgi:predicted metal-dependent phosphoesterase TrpH
MPARQPFTRLCQQLARSRADLHLHTTHSDGLYAPAEVAGLARRSGLAAIAITDHDTTGGVAAARAAGTELEVITGVEITTEYHGRELHLLAYFIDEDNEPLQAALLDVRQGRVERFRAMIERLHSLGVSVEEEAADSLPEALGRRYLAELLVKQGQVGSVREAFSRWLADGGRAEVPKKRLPVADAIDLVRRAGGVAAWAHPAYDVVQENLAELAHLGLGAVEVEYPEARRGRVDQLRSWAAALGLAVSGGSDCHGPGPRAIGSRTISNEELDRLRAASERAMISPEDQR